jgi:hypothetical protein
MALSWSSAILSLQLTLFLVLSHTHPQGANGTQLGVQWIAILVIFAWAAAIGMIVWIPLKLIGWV